MRRWLPFVLVGVVFAVLTLFSAPAGGSRSVTDRTGRGYRAAFSYLGGDEGGRVAAWDEPPAALAGLPADTTLVLTWPMERPLDGAADANHLLAWVSGGGRLVLLLDGTSEKTPPVELVEDALRVTLVREAPEPPYAWGEWKAWSATRRTAASPYGTLALGEPTWRLVCPLGAESLAETEDGYQRACRVTRGRGEVVVVSDATVWQNDHLARADNLALLDGLLGGRTVRFGEWHHGAAPVVASVPRHVPVLLFGHLGALWLLGALTLARRFGDPLPPPALAAPSMARALHALATLHRGAGHAHDAAARLYALLRARGARRGLDPDALPRPDVSTDDALLDYAAHAARVQRDHRL